jgi:chromosome segregation ATPase
MTCDNEHCAKVRVELHRTTDKLGRLKKHLKHLERERRNAGRVGELERRIERLGGDVCSAVAAQARAERERDRVIDELASIDAVITEHVGLDGDDTSERVRRVVSFLLDEQARAMNLEDELRQAHSALHDNARTMAMGEA